MSHITSRQAPAPDGRYAFTRNPVAPPGPHDGPPTIEHYTGGVLVDEQTGKRTPLRRPGCYGLIAGGPWLLLYCDAVSAYELYSIPHPRLVRTTPAASGMNPGALGTYWIQYFVVADGSYGFQKIETGQMRTLPAWRPGGRTIPDLDSKSLAPKLCSPLRVPMDWTPYARWSAYLHNEKLHTGTVTSSAGSRSSKARTIPTALAPTPPRTTFNDADPGSRSRPARPSSPIRTPSSAAASTNAH